MGRCAASAKTGGAGRGAMDSAMRRGPAQCSGGGDTALRFGLALPDGSKVMAPTPYLAMPTEPTEPPAAVTRQRGDGGSVRGGARLPRRDAPTGRA